MKHLVPINKIWKINQEIVPPYLLESIHTKQEQYMKFLYFFVKQSLVLHGFEVYQVSNI